jgi:hypothetical protein
MSSDPVRPDPGFDESEAKHIMARAAALDAQRGERLDAATLRAIAAEAGISPAAVDEAIRERQHPPTPVMRSWQVRYVGVFILLGLVVATLVSRLFP